jgi:hypothetical protein
MDIFVQKYICRLFALNTILAGYYACVNAMYTYYKLYSNSAVVPHIKGAHRGAEVIYNTVVYTTLFRVYSTSCSGICTFMCPRYASNTKLVQSR